MVSVSAALIDKVSRQFKARFGRSPQGIARAPGRVNLLGEHVDYNQGIVMPAAIECATYLAFSPSGQAASTLVACDLGGEASFTSQTLEEKKGTDGEPLPLWALYPAGVAQVLLSHGYPAVPMLAAYASEVPRGAGLSSSASVEAAVITAWVTLGGLSLQRMEQAQMCLQAEVDYVGLDCGLMDQFASLCGQPDRLLMLDCRSLEWQALDLPPQAAIVIADAGLRRSLADSSYNQRHRECEQAVRLLRAALPGVNSLRDLSLEDLDRHAHLLPSLLEKRARHVVQEIERVRQGAICLSRGDPAGHGRLMNASHASLRDLYQVSTTELDLLAETAQSLPGCYGSRLTGAGFGGCTVSLVAGGELEQFMSALKLEFHKLTGMAVDVFSTRAAAGAGLI